jgi:hypothetical protein
LCGWQLQASLGIHEGPGCLQTASRRHRLSNRIKTQPYIAIKLVLTKWNVEFQVQGKEFENVRKHMPQHNNERSYTRNAFILRNVEHILVVL